MPPGMSVQRKFLGMLPAGPTTRLPARLAYRATSPTLPHTTQSFPSDYRNKLLSALRRSAAREG